MTLDSGELTDIQSEAVDYLPDSATLLIRSEVSDGGGGQTETWTAGETVACRLAPFGSSSSAHGIKKVADRLHDDSSHLLTVPAGTALADQDRVTVNGVSYDVLAAHVRSYEMTRVFELKQTP